ncbi:DUF2878 domain-containing protein [Colwellia sp. MEBiC06753]
MIINALCFNLAWLGLILFGNSVIPLVFIWLSWHIWQCQHPRQELTLMLVVTTIGTVIDSALMHAGVFDFAEGGAIIPLWLIIIWLSFSATLQHSLKFLNTNKLFPYLVGALIVPLSYLAGERLGAVSFLYGTTQTLIILACLWFLLLPFLMSLNKRSFISYA